jgi:predicted flap endonuclease-1-like 5' DNA nuclease
MAKIVDIEGIGPIYAEKLGKFGIRTTEALLEQGASAKGRKEIAEKTGIKEGLILEWVNRADLYRIKGIGSEYSDLLEASGVDSVPELAMRKPENLLEKLTEVNLAKKLVRKLPTIKQVISWVEQSKMLPKLVTH